MGDTVYWLGSVTVRGGAGDMSENGRTKMGDAIGGHKGERLGRVGVELMNVVHVITPRREHIAPDRSNCTGGRCMFLRSTFLGPRWQMMKMRGMQGRER